MSIEKYIKSIKLALVAMGCIIFNNSIGQQITLIDLPADFERTVEISGMVKKSGQFYLPAEKEGKIYVIDEKNYSLTDTKDLVEKGMDSRSEIEAITLYNNYFLMTNEAIKTGAKIYAYNTKKDTVTEAIFYDFNIGSYTKENGIEGIAVNQDKNILYLMRERNGKGQSEIFTFKIDTICHTIYLWHQSTVRVSHKGCRYTDICYYDNKLFCLKSCFNEKNRLLSDYSIQYLILDHASGDISNPSSIATSVNLNLPVLMNRCIYNANIEGLYVNKDIMYVVSDNKKHKSDPTCGQEKSKTLFMEIKP